MKTPRKATLDFIRQFASAYAVLPEMGHTAMIPLIAGKKKSCFPDKVAALSVNIALIKSAAEKVEKFPAEFGGVGKPACVVESGSGGVLFFDASHFHTQVLCGAADNHAFIGKGFS